MSAIQDYEQPVPRSVFITVLCILTFIGSTMSLVKQSIVYFTADSQATSFSIARERIKSDAKTKSESDKGAQFAQKFMGSLNISAGNIRKGALSDIMAAILCLTGALLMWKLQRRGFYLYVAGTLLGIISPFVIYGGSNIISIFSSVIWGIIGLAFVILYAVNLKDMK